jgi:hypothetical protein
LWFARTFSRRARFTKRFTASVSLLQHRNIVRHQPDQPVDSDFLQVKESGFPTVNCFSRRGLRCGLRMFILQWLCHSSERAWALLQEYVEQLAAKPPPSSECIELLREIDWKETLRCEWLLLYSSELTCRLGDFRLGAFNSLASLDILGLVLAFVSFTTLHTSLAPTCKYVRELL